jgi:hypothetical protein
VSSPRALESSTPLTADAGAPNRAPLVPADFREHMTKVVDRQASRGHALRFDAIVWANDAARGAWEGAGDMPDGAILVEEAIERTAKGDGPAGILLMEKKEGAWRFAAAGPKGELPDLPAGIAMCAACHADAPRDSVFRVPGK